MTIAFGTDCVVTTCMRSSILTSLVCSSLLASTVIACTGEDGTVDVNEEDGVVVPEGKEDDFFSTAASEYIFQGRAQVKVDAGQGLAEAKKLIGLKHTAIAWFLNAYLVDKEHEEANANYGGFNAMVKTGAYTDLAITDKGGGVFEFTFKQIVAGPKTLLSSLPLTAGKIKIEIGKPSNEEMGRLETNNEWYRQAPWDGWNPSMVAADKKETIEFAVSREKASNDAWWDYKKLLADNKLTIDAHFGWDYHSEFHTKHSHELYDWLITRGFKSPVASWDKYTRTSGPLTRTMKANGRNIAVEVKIFYGRIGTDTDPDTAAGGIVLENDMRASLNTQDVVIYSGHSGPFYGFALANWRKTSEGDLDDTDMTTVQMPSDKYQIVLAEGCDTYMIGQAFKQNPNKLGKNIDIVTTTSFSNAGTAIVVETFIDKLLENSSGTMRAKPVSVMLTDVTSTQAYGFSTLYGIHGIDDNPQLSPFADVSKSCKSCTTNASCGASGNSCVSLGAGGGKVCAAACTTDAACPTGYACRNIAAGSTVFTKACVPKTNRCN